MTPNGSMAKMLEDDSLRVDEINEESSIESSLQSGEDDLELEDSDLNSGPGIDSSDSDDDDDFSDSDIDQDSEESPLLSVGSDIELSDSLDDESDSDLNDEIMAAYRFKTLTGAPLARITEHTRETSISCRTTTFREDPSLRLTSPSGRARQNLVRRSPRKKSPRGTVANSEDTTNTDEGNLGEVSDLSNRVIVLEVSCPLGDFAESDKKGQND